MSIEQPNQTPAPVEKALPNPEVTAENMIRSFLGTSQEYQDRRFTEEEIKTAAALLSNANIGGHDDELARKALDARLAVRAQQSGAVRGYTDKPSVQ